MADTVKLKDIAEKMQVSVVTISNALSGKKGVSEQTRQEIMKTAREMGYDVSKYEEKDENSLKIGVIVSEKYLAVGTSFYWAMYQQVAYAVSKRHGFTMFEMIGKTIKENSELPKLITEEAIDGLIVIGWVERNYIERILKTVKVPVVLLDFNGEDLYCDAVMSSNYIGMYKVTDYVIQKGHQDLAFVGSRRANENIDDRFYGFRKAIEKHGLKLRREWILEDRDIETGDIEIELPENMPTAFICNSDYSASHLYDVLKEKGYRIPEDISIASYDNYLFGHPFAKKLTTYNVDMEQMAKTAVHVLMKKIKGCGNHLGVRYVDSYVVERGSVKEL